MKVALVVPGGVDRSGVERVIPCLLWLVERLAREHQVHVFALRHEPRASRYPLLGATVHNVGRPGWRTRAVAGIAREHRREPFDLLHAFWAVPSGVVTRLAAGVLRRPYLLHLPGGDLASLPEIGYGLRRTLRGRLWLRFAASGARRILVPSGPMRVRARELGMDTHRVPFGVALDRWAPLPPRRRPPDRPARLLFVGSLNRVKGPELLLEVAARLRGEGDSFILDVVGEDVLEGRVQRRVTALELGDRVRFHGFVPHPELRSRVAGADLLLVTSHHEAGPVVALEAAVLGVPAVGTDVGHLADWAPEAAVTVPVGDAAALAEEVTRLLRDDRRRRALGEAAQERALSEDADHTARRMSELYREAVDEARR